MGRRRRNGYGSGTAFGHELDGYGHGLAAGWEDGYAAGSGTADGNRFGSIHEYCPGTAEDYRQEKRYYDAMASRWRWMDIAMAMWRQRGNDYNE